jgi:hypothetical protein
MRARQAALFLTFFEDRLTATLASAIAMAY